MCYNYFEIKIDTKFMKKLLKYFDVFSPCREAGVNIWSCPSFIFIIIGIADILITISVYYVAKFWTDPIIMLAGLGGINIFILLIGGIITNAQERILKASKMKSEFVSIASHQLRAPLGNIRWVLDLLQGQRIGELSNKQLEYVENIHENNERMLKLVNDLLNVSRINDGKMSVLPRFVCFENIIKQAAAEFDLYARAHNIEIKMSIESGLPPVFVDVEKIKIVLENLIDNAIKYSRRKGNVKISAAVSGENILFQIEDSGVGIPKDQQKNVFEKFFRSDNALKHEVIGTGLGLHITKAIIENSGGKIWFSSKEGIGSKFSFTIPTKK